MLHHPEKDNLMLAGSLRTRQEKAARRKERQEYWDSLDEHVQSPQDVKKLLLTAIAEVKSGELDHKQASNISSLSGHLIKVLEVGDIEEKLKYLEERLKEKGKQQDGDKAGRDFLLRGRGRGRN